MTRHVLSSYCNRGQRPPYIEFMSFDIPIPNNPQAWKDCEAQLNEVMVRDRFRLSRRLQEIKKLPANIKNQTEQTQSFAKKSSDQTDNEPHAVANESEAKKLNQEIKNSNSEKNNQESAWATWCAQVKTSLEKVAARRALIPADIHFPDLPINEKRDDIAQMIRDHQVIVLAGETGSGKTTQLPKICLSIGRGLRGQIGHTQPRRIAATSVATRIAEELQSPLGEKVGYQVRFSDQSKDTTLIKVMTDGILLAEIQQDPFLNKYDTLIIDEAHERSLNIDFLLGYLKQLLPRRPDLKLIITSATIDLQKFSAHFTSHSGQAAPIIEVSGRTYPVDVWYRPPYESKNDSDEADSEPDINSAIVDAVHEIEQHEKMSGQRGGDILVFLSGEREIREAAEALRKAQIQHMEVLPFYARLSLAEQQKVFSSHTGRRIVLATNVAETSITVPGIRYVIDPGLARISRYSYRTKVQRLPIEAVSQASANQRKGRCGRVAEGICIRLYSEEDFNNRPAFTDAEILRTNLAAVILQMLSLRMGDIQKFPFIDAPDHRLISDGYKLLEELQAVHKNQLTDIGKQLCHLPLDPRLARMLIAAQTQGSIRELLIVASALSVQDPRERPIEKQQHADQMHRRFWSEDSDFVGFINLWNYFEEQRQALSQNQLRKLCKKEFLNYLRLREWRDVHHQLSIAVKELGFKQNVEPASYERIHQALLTGLLGNLGFNHEEKEYLGARNRKFSIFPGSSLKKKTPKWIMAAELIETSQVFAHSVARIEPEWALIAAKHLVKRNYFEPHYNSHSGQVMAFEKVSLYGLTLIEKKSVPYAHIDPVLAREIFIRSALVEGQYGEHPQRKASLRKNTAAEDFFSHQQNLLRELEDLENKSRRRDILADEQVIFDFYDSILPAEVCNKTSFEHWRKTAEKENPTILFIARESLMRHGALDITHAQFPSELEWRGMVFPLTYHFEPNHADDGVSLHAPVSLLHQIPELRLQWLVPGMLRDKAIQLVKSLPKSLRKHFVPVPDAVDKALSQMVPDNKSFTEQLGLQLKRLFGVEIKPEDWAEAQVDTYYQFNIKVLDDHGKVIGQARDLTELRQQYRSQVQENIQSAATHLERVGIFNWDFGDLPEFVNLKRSGLNIRAYPALVDQKNSVAIQVLDNPKEANVVTRRALCRLIFLNLNQQIKYLQKELLKGQDVVLTVASMGSRDQVIDDLILSAIKSLVDEAGVEAIRNEHSFKSLKEKIAPDLIAKAQEIAQNLLNSLKLLVEVKSTIKAQKNQLLLAFAISDIQQQLKYLFFEGVLFKTSWVWLQQYPRYLKAILLRLEKLSLNPQKDKLMIQEISGYWEKYAAFIEQRPAYEWSDNQALIEYRWWIEEFRISLFAQTIKTIVPVSAKRLDKQWEQVISH